MLRGQHAHRRLPNSGVKILAADRDWSFRCLVIHLSLHSVRSDSVGACCQHLMRSSTMPRAVNRPPWSFRANEP